MLPPAISSPTPLRALILAGGWAGHEPDIVAAIFAAQLRERGFAVQVATTLDTLLDPTMMAGLTLLVPIYTMSSITPEQLSALLNAVQNGVGIGGVHGGMADAFRQETEYQFMVGGQWVAHPGGDGVAYTVQVTAPEHVIMRGAPRQFAVQSEQYYLHVDPANHVLATTRFPTPGVDGPHVPNGTVEMPVVWTKHYGHGRVFYCSLGHHADVIRQPTVLRICTRGLLWSARAESLLAAVPENSDERGGMEAQS